MDVFRLAGLKKGEIEARLAPLKKSGLGFEVEESCYDAKVSLRPAKEMSETRFEELKCKAYQLFEDEVYAMTDSSLQETAVKLLMLNKKTLSVAESLTGGEICSRLTEISGVSSCFYEGIVCYNRKSKMARLGVTRRTLADYGAVSRQTAIEMVKGLIGVNADIGLATTGLAGPLGDEDKPVGLVYIGVGSGDFLMAFEKHFAGSRNEVRAAAANLALFYLIRYLRGDILRL